MRKLLNTLYVTNEKSYLSLEGENLVLFVEGKEVIRLPFTNIESILCLNYLGCSPALMGKCAEYQIGLCFISPTGRFLARVTGEVKGNVFLRKKQVELFADEEKQLELSKSIISAKLKNTKSLLNRSKRDYPQIDGNGDISHSIDVLNSNLQLVRDCCDLDVLRGIEGQSAKSYFDIYDRLFTQQREDFTMASRSKRPPLDRTNAMLSFLYTVCTNDIASALECVGLDPYVGVFHTLRSGRVSLACDMIEEFRAMIDRLVITLVNLKVVNKGDFEEQIGGAVLLTDEGRKKVVSAWQNKKREIVKHPFLKEKIAYGLFPYVQANLMAKYIRGENQKYVNLEL